MSNIPGRYYDENGNCLTVKSAAIGVGSSGDNQLVAAVTGKKIRVLGFHGMALTAVNGYFTSGAGGAVIWGGSTNKIPFGATGGYVLPVTNLMWFETVAGQALVLNLSAGVGVGGGVVYVEV